MSDSSIVLKLVFHECETKYVARPVRGPEMAMPWHSRKSSRTVRKSAWLCFVAGSTIRRQKSLVVRSLSGVATVLSSASSTATLMPTTSS